MKNTRILTSFIMSINVRNNYMPPAVRTSHGTDNGSAGHSDNTMFPVQLLLLRIATLRKRKKKFNTESWQPENTRSSTVAESPRDASCHWIFR